MRRCLTAVLLATVAIISLSGCAAYVEPAPVVYHPYYYDPYYYHTDVVVVGGGYYGRRWR